MTVNINNTTNKIVKKIKIAGEELSQNHCAGLEMGNVGLGLCRHANAAPSCLPPVDQITDVVLYSLDKYSKTVCMEEIK